MGGIPSNSFIITQRREKVFTLLCEGLNETEIAMKLTVGQSTVCRDIKAIKKQSQKKIESIMVDVLPYEYEKSIVTMRQITKECWDIYHDKSGQWTNKNKIDILKLLKESVTTSLEILAQGPLNLRANQLEEKVKDLLEESETPEQNFMNLRLPAVKGQKDVDLR
jgi:hypothetical protein